MSAQTPEKPTNPYQLRCEAVARAIKAWQRQAEEADDAGDREPTAMENAAELEDCLMDEGLVLMPRSTGHGKWIVCVDDQPACLPGKDRPAGPMDAEDAAELWLTLTAADTYNEQQVSIRPAAEMELVASLWEHITGGAL